LSKNSQSIATMTVFCLADCLAVTTSSWVGNQQGHLHLPVNDEQAKLTQAIYSMLVLSINQMIDIALLLHTQMIFW